MNAKNRIPVGRPKSRAHLIPILAILISIILLLLSACSQPDQPTSANLTEAQTTTAAQATTAQTTAAQTTAVQTTAAASTTSTSSGTDATSADGETGVQPFSAEDLVIEVQGVTARLLEDAAPLMSVLGDDYQLSEAESCVYEGMDKTFDYGHIVVYTVPADDHDLLDGLDMLDDQLATARGIRVGDSRDAVLAAYGPQAGSESDLVYNVPGDIEKLAEPRLTFIMDGDTVVAISFYSGSNAQS